MGDLTARFSVYLKAAYDLDLDGRSRRLDERAGVDKLNARRLRGLIGLWKRHLEATPNAADPVLGVWRSFAALPQNEFAAKAKDLHRDLTKPKRPESSADTSAGRSSRARHVRRRARAKWSRGTSRFSASSKRV